MIILAFTLILTSSFASSTFDVNDDVLFSFNYKSVDSLEQKKSIDNFVPIVTKDKEKYYCELPASASTEKNYIPSFYYDGPNEQELLRPIFKSKKCTIKLEPYWAYELCHSKSIRQYHGHLDDSTAQQYRLGFYSPYNNFLDHRLQGLNTITLEGQDYPYYQVNYTAGDVCDLTGLRRSVNVLYICNELSIADIYQIVEIESCKYQIVVLTKFLCSHPKYKVRVKHVNKINCYTQKEQPKPKSFVAYEQAKVNLNQGKFSSNLDALFDSSDLHNIKIEAKREKSGIVYRIKMSNDDKNELFETLKSEMEESVPKDQMEEIMAQAEDAISKLTDTSLSDLAKASKDSKTVDSAKADLSTEQPKMVKNSYTALSVVRADELREFFRRGSSKCFISGFGWWQQMLCFGSHIVQFHDNPDGSRQSITLGKWNVRQHLKANLENINIRKNTQFTLYHYYLDGDLCEETGKPRETILKLTCDPKVELLQQTFREEPVCKYTFEMKSAALCPIIALADLTTGVIPVDAL